MILLLLDGHGASGLVVAAALAAVALRGI